jgi:hypothetical protein
MTIAAGEFPAQDLIEGNGRIDHVLWRGPGFHTLASTIVFSQELNGVWMSDHYGVLTTLEVDPIGGGNGPMPSMIPNPVYDRDDGGRASRLIRVSDQWLRCAAPASEELLGTEANASETFTHSCELPAMDLVSHEKGVTFLNESTSKISIRVRPKFTTLGRVWARQTVSLDPGHAAAYFFDPDAEYEFGVRGGGKAAFGGFKSDQ